MRIISLLIAILAAFLGMGAIVVGITLISPLAGHVALILVGGLLLVIGVGFIDVEVNRGRKQQ